jgi:preprotein translocase subunit YajC
MSEFVVRLPVIFAQEGAGATWLPYIYLLPIPFLFYFMILRPQHQADRKRREMIDAMKKNDKVLTTGGILGTVISVDAASDRVVLRIDDEKGIKVTFTKSSVAKVLEPSSDKT